jgi:surface antigen
MMINAQLEKCLMKKISIILLIGIAVTLTGCATTTSPQLVTAKSTTDANQTITPDNTDNIDKESSAAGPTSIQESNTTLPSTSDAGIGGTSIGGAVEQGMDETDKSKMLHAMDKAPGKSTHWLNAHTQIKYTVIPTKKVRIQDKNYCRQYEMTAIDTNDREQTVQGVACIASDGNWHTLET